MLGRRAKMILRKRRTSVSGQLQSTAAHILPPHLPLQLASWMTSLEKSIHKSSMKVKRKRGGLTEKIVEMEVRRMSRSLRMMLMSLQTVMMSIQKTQTMLAGVA